MPNLSGYLDFTVLLDFSTNKIVVSVPNNFPVGVAAGITGIISVTQPDDIKKVGAWSSPDIYWNGSELIAGTKVLRRTAQKTALKGNYSITVTIRHSDYDETILTKKFKSTYEQPKGRIEREFDVFTPSLFLDDETIYNSPDFITDELTREWNVTIGSLGNLVATEKRVDLRYSGKYYDAKYISLLKVHAQYVSTTGEYSFLRIKDYYEFATIEYANTPLAYPELLAALNEIKAEDDNSCGTKKDSCGCGGSSGGYERALELFQHIKERICGFDTIELYTYLEEFLSIYGRYNSKYENTNEQIVSYDRSFCANDPESGDDPNPSLPEDIEFIVGITPGAPIGGDDHWINPALDGWNIRLFISKVGQSQIDDGSGVYFSKPKASNTITLIGQSFVHESLVQIQFVAGKKNYSSDAGSTQVQANVNETNPASPAYIKNFPTSFNPKPHTHTMGEVGGLVSALAGKSPVGHTHAQSEVTGLDGALSAKADKTTTYTKSEVDVLIDSVSNTSSSFLSDRYELTQSLNNILPVNLNKLHQINAGATSVTFQLPDVAGLGSGVCVIECLYQNVAQHKIQANPGQIIFYNGGFKNYIWIGSSEYVWLFYSAAGWFVINTNIPFHLIGQPQFVFKLGINQVALDGSIQQRVNTRPRLFETVQGFGNSYITESLWNTASVTIGGTSVPKPYRGCYSNGNNSSTFRLPDFRGSSIRGLNVFDGVGVDPQRVHNFPGGFQLNEFKEHRHFGWVDKGIDNDNHPYQAGKEIGTGNSPVRRYAKGGGSGGESYSGWGETDEPTVGRSSKSGGSETRMDNIGGLWVTNF